MHSRARHELETLLEALTLFTPRVEAEDALALQAGARPSRGTPVLAPSQLDDYPAATCYLDLGALQPGEAQALGEQIQQLILERAGLSSKLGISAGRFPARVAALAVEQGEVLVIPPRQEAHFLAAFTVALLPVDGETLRQLDLLGMHTLGQIADLPAGALVDRFGAQGRIMHRLARGRDSTPVAPYKPPLLLRLARAFDGGVDDWQIVERMLADLAQQAAGQLQQAGRAVRQITLVLVLEDDTPLEQQVVLRQPASQARHLAETLIELARSLSPAQPVAAAEALLSDIAPAVPRQLSLFERPTVSESHLSAVLKDLAARYGAAHFYWLRAADDEARLPERRYRWEQA
jgi:nucleotidyltransferase/DNA polymerase involved in DNA repair